MRKIETAPYKKEMTKKMYEGYRNFIRDRNRFYLSLMQETERVRISNIPPRGSEYANKD